MRAILIDVAAKQVSEIEIDGSLKSLQSAVGGYIEAALEFPNADTLYVNEEGLLHGEQNFFELYEKYQPFAGNGIIVGFGGEVENVPAKTSVEDIVKTIRWVNRKELEQRYG